MGSGSCGKRRAQSPRPSGLETDGLPATDPDNIERLTHRADGAAYPRSTVRKSSPKAKWFPLSNAQTCSIVSLT